jgi:hypothetical protein
MKGELTLERFSGDTGGGAISVARIPGVSELWRVTKGDPRVTIAVVDGPVDRAHPALVDARLEIVAGLAQVMPVMQGWATRHGTQVASLIFGGHDAKSCVAGVAPGCRGLLAPVFRDQARGQGLAGQGCSQLDLARALLQAAKHGADIINVSGGEFAPEGRANAILTDAVSQCVRRGILIVAAAGNDGCSCLHVPAALPGVLAVGAMTLDGEPLVSSNWGEAYRSTGLLAPGTNLRAAAPGGGVTTVSGTSFAAAIVSGVAGLLLSLARVRGSRWNGQQVRHFLLDWAHKCLDDSIPCRQRLAGRLDLTKAALIQLMQVQPMSDHSDGSLVDVRADDAGAAPASTPAQVPDLAAGVVASAGAGCESCRAKTAVDPFGPGNMVFALGHLDIDLVSETRQFSLQQHLWEFRHEKHGVPHDPTRLPNQAEANPFDHHQLLEYVEDEKNGWDATAVHWVLKHHQMPIYAIAPGGPFAHRIYSRLIETMREQLADRIEERVEWVSIPGRLGGVARLYHGQSVPVIVPEPRGMYSWNLVKLVNKIARDGDARGAQMVSECLDRVYHDMRNLGLTARDRAINYAVTNAAQVGNVFEKVFTTGEAVALDTIDAEPSSHCPPGADCWDVTLHFFYPERPTQSTRRAYRFSVDVGDIVPVMVGPLRAWYAR